jgi:hypothetical protein
MSKSFALIVFGLIPQNVVGYNTYLLNQAISEKTPKQHRGLSDFLLALPFVFTQNTTQAKISSFKNPHIKIDLLLPRGQNPLSSTTLYNETKHNILALVGKAKKDGRRHALK